MQDKTKKDQKPDQVLKVEVMGSSCSENRPSPVKES